MAQEQRPAEGGVTIVLDVPTATVDDVIAGLSAAGFSTRRYYPDEVPRCGGAPAGHTRLGAEQAWHSLPHGARHDIGIDARAAAVIAQFDRFQQRTGLSGIRVGTDIWTAGDDDGFSGDREPRMPAPVAGSGGAAALAARPAC